MVRTSKQARHVAVVFVLALACWVPATETSADPGSCAYWSEGPTQSGFSWTYVVANRCSTNVKAKLWENDLNRYAQASAGGTCETIPAGYHANFWDSVPSWNNWTVAC
jgi:hypothetical protein